MNIIIIIIIGNIAKNCANEMYSKHNINIII